MRFFHPYPPHPPEACPPKWTKKWIKKWTKWTAKKQGTMRISEAQPDFRASAPAVRQVCQFFRGLGEPQILYQTDALAAAVSDTLHRSNSEDSVERYGCNFARCGHSATAASEASEDSVVAEQNSPGHPYSRFQGGRWRAARGFYSYTYKGGEWGYIPHSPPLNNLKLS